MTTTPPRRAHIADNGNIKVDGHTGTWYVIEERKHTPHGHLYLLEHTRYGDDAPCLIISKTTGTFVLEDAWNGFLDYEEWLVCREICGL